MKNNITEVVFILDRSGSMGGLEADTIGGFNANLKKQREIGGKCYLTTVLFDNEYEMIHDRVDINEAKELTEKEYFVRGSTALVDAIGISIDHIEKIHKYARPEDVPEHTVFIITTDGMENSSSKYTAADVKKTVKKKKKEGWEFLFLGANIDAVETAVSFGIDEDRAVNYVPDSVGTVKMHKSVAGALCSMRTCGSISDKWCGEANADYESRKGTKKSRKSR